MNTFLIGVFVLNLFMGVHIGSLLIRNSKVYKLRQKMVDKIFSFSDWKWRLKIYETVSYNAMLYKFWKPVVPESFYDDLSFLHSQNVLVKSSIQIKNIKL